ncbi:MAG: extracellular solute-binding protein [Oscillospiraceae bacterium]|jgi:putative aldouronate transport system substrate-binding protein|nr:extracellular solute-binding protein [Oscillospiraceae bacterium]
MHKTFTRWATLLLALLMVLPVAGFAAAEFPVVDPTLPADWAPFEERVTITVPVYDRSKEGYPAVDDNYWTQWIQNQFGDKWNIDVQYVAIPRGDVMTKYTMLIAGGETPTIMMEYDYPKVTQWANDGAMTTIDLEAFKAVAPTYYQAMVDNNQLGYTDVNGETYFVLSERPYYDTPYNWYTWVRMDWLEAVGYDHVPQNYAEHVDAMTKIMEAGLTDQAPMPLGLPASAYIVNFGFRDYPVDEAEWVMHSSLGTPGFAWYPTERMLRRFNTEYNAGWYSKEFDLTVTMAGMTSQDETDFINGKTYQYGGYASANMAWLTAFYENNPDAKLAIASAYAAVEDGVNMGTLRADNPFGMIVGFSSLATDDQLKAAWMLMEWMIQPDVLFTLENGIEGVTYTIGEDGLPVVNGDYRGEEMHNHNMNIDMTCLVHASKKVGTIEQSIAGLVPQGIPQNFYEEMLAVFNDNVALAEAGLSYSDPIFAVSIESESEYNATLLSLYQEYFAKLVKADPAEFDALYAELCQSYLDAGYQEIIDERLAAYEAGQTTKLPVAAE